MYKLFFKRFVDFWIALIALLVISPLLLVVTIWLHFANKGAGVFFFQERSGKDGMLFKVIKFKSMTDERDNNGDFLPDEMRLTNVGRFIRSTSIDELPQLVNVLIGDMALIGPRPLTPAYAYVYNDFQKRRMEVRPGISGWAQVNGRQNCKLSKKFEYDVWYVDHCCLMTDLRIIYMTIGDVLGRKGIGVGSGSMDDIDDLGFKQKFDDLKKQGKI